LFKVTMTARGQVLIPVELRRRLHLTSGTRFTVSDADGKIVLVPELPDAVGAGFGFLGRRLMRPDSGRDEHPERRTT